MTEQFQEPSSNAPDQVTEETPTTSSDPAIVIGDREFKSPEDLTKSFTHAQAHISTLESENAALRAQLEESKKVEEILAKLDTSAQAKSQEAPQPSQPNQAIDIDDLLEKKLSQKQREQVEATNYQACLSKAKEVLGDDYLSKLNGLQTELGISGVSLAKSSPKAFEKLFLSNGQSSAPAASTTSLNPAAFNQPPKTEPSAKVTLVGASDKDLVNAWKASGEKIKNQLQS